MKRNSVIILIWVLVSCLIMCYKYKKDSYDMPFVFERNMVENETFHFCNEVDIKEGIGKETFLLNDSIAIFYEQKEGKALFQYYNFNKESVDRIEEAINSDGVIVSIDDEKYVYVDKYALKSRNIYDSKIDLLYEGEVAVFFAHSCNDSVCLSFGCETNANTTVTGFYKLVNGTSCLIKGVEESDDEKSKYVNFLSYNGTFQKNNNYLVYMCEVRSLIYIFDLNGNYVNTIKTKDNIPNPVISLFNDTYVYTRGNTFNSSKGTFVENDYIYVLSYRSTNKENVIIDKYSIEGGNYIDSFMIPELSCGNSDIDKLYQIGSSILFYKNGKLFVFKR